jgi:hypothetical protein
MFRSEYETTYNVQNPSNPELLLKYIFTITWRKDKKSEVAPALN